MKKINCEKYLTLKQRRKLISEMRTSLDTDLLKVWYPESLDSSHGGFLSDLTYDWKPYGPQHKMLVTQARHVWTASRAALFYEQDRFRRIAEHGFHFLKNSMWDTDHGGFYMLRRFGKSRREIDDTRALVKKGVYKYIRHPLYSSLLFLTLGAFLKDISLVSVLLAVAASGLSVAVAKFEEREDIRKFGDEYRSYIENTRMFIPYII